MDQERETSELSITRRLLVGLRNVMLEAITDLVYADSAEQEQLARQAFAYMTAVIHHPESTSEPQAGVLSIRLASADGDDFVLEATRELLGMLARAVDHVQRNLLEFELPIRVKLDSTELAALWRMLEEYALS